MGSVSSVRHRPSQLGNTSLMLKGSVLLNVRMIRMEIVSLAMLILRSVKNAQKDVLRVPPRRYALAVKQVTI